MSWVFQLSSHILFIPPYFYLHCAFAFLLISCILFLRITHCVAIGELHKRTQKWKFCARPKYSKAIFTFILLNLETFRNKNEVLTIITFSYLSWLSINISCITLEIGWMTTIWSLLLEVCTWIIQREHTISNLPIFSDVSCLPWLLLWWNKTTCFWYPYIYSLSIIWPLSIFFFDHCAQFEKLAQKKPNWKSSCGRIPEITFGKLYFSNIRLYSENWKQVISRALKIEFGFKLGTVEREQQ